MDFFLSAYEERTKSFQPSKLEVELGYFESGAVSFLLKKIREVIPREEAEIASKLVKFGGEDLVTEINMFITGNKKEFHEAFTADQTDRKIVAKELTTGSKEKDLAYSIIKTIDSFVDTFK